MEQKLLDLMEKGVNNSIRMMACIFFAVMLLAALVWAATAFEAGLTGYITLLVLFMPLVAYIFILLVFALLIKAAIDFFKHR